MNNVGSVVANTVTTSFRFNNMIGPIVFIALGILELITYVVVSVRRIRATPEDRLIDHEISDIQAQITSLRHRPVKNPINFSSSCSLSVRSATPPSISTVIVSQSNANPALEVIGSIDRDVIIAILEEIRKGNYQEITERIERDLPFQEGEVLAATLRSIGKKISERDKVTPLGEQRIKLVAMTLVQQILADEKLCRTKRPISISQFESIASGAFSDHVESLTQRMQSRKPFHGQMITCLKENFLGIVQSFQQIHQSQLNPLDLKTPVQPSSLMELQIRFSEQFAQICEEIWLFEESTIHERITSFI